MTALILPDVEALVIDFLLDDGDVAAIADDRVYSVMPSNIGPEPFVRVTQFDSTNVLRTLDYLENPIVQVDAYGGPKATASLLARTCRAALSDLPGAYTGCVVTGVTPGGVRYEPDSDFKNPRPRWLFTVELWLHPIATGS